MSSNTSRRRQRTGKGIPRTCSRCAATLNHKRYIIHKKSGWQRTIRLGFNDQPHLLPDPRTETRVDDTSLIPRSTRIRVLDLMPSGQIVAQRTLQHNLQIIKGISGRITTGHIPPEGQRGLGGARWNDESLV